MPHGTTATSRLAAATLMVAVFACTSIADSPSQVADQVLDLRQRQIDGGGDSPLRSDPLELAQAVQRLAAGVDQFPPPQGFINSGNAVNPPLNSGPPWSPGVANAFNNSTTPPLLPSQRAQHWPTAGAATSPDAARRLLKETAFQLDTHAHRLEMHELCGQADQLRELANRLRGDARNLPSSQPTPHYQPTPASPRPNVGPVPTPTNDSGLRPRD